MSAPSSIPPVLSTRHARAYLRHLLETQPQVSATTVAPAHVQLAATTALPALEHAARLGIARWQELNEEQYR